MVCKLKTCKFRLGIAFYHWTIWSLCVETTAKAWNWYQRGAISQMEHEFQFRIFRTEKGLPFQIFRCMFPEIFPWKDPKKCCSIYLLTGFSGNIFVIGTSVSVCLQTNFKSIYFAGGVWGGGGGGRA